MPKATVVGPVEVAINLIGELDVIRDQMENLTPIVNAELRGLAEADCPVRSPFNLPSGIRILAEHPIDEPIAGSRLVSL